MKHILIILTLFLATQAYGQKHWEATSKCDANGKIQSITLKSTPIQYKTDNVASTTQEIDQDDSEEVELTGDDLVKLFNLSVENGVKIRSLENEVASIKSQIGNIQSRPQQQAPQIIYRDAPQVQQPVSLPAKQYTPPNYVPRRDRDPK